MDLIDLQTKGWMLVDGVSSPSDLLDLGRSIGSPVPAPNGELVKEIRRIPAAEARSGSQSAMYGFGPFPLHTDTVFWPVPVRYVVLRAFGDTRRPTTVKRFRDLLQKCDPREFSCSACELHLTTYAALETAGLGAPYTRTTRSSPEDYYGLISPDDLPSYLEDYVRNLEEYDNE